MNLYFEKVKEMEINDVEAFDNYVNHLRYITQKPIDCINNYNYLNTVNGDYVVVGETDDYTYKYIEYINMSDGLKKLMAQVLSEFDYMVQDMSGWKINAQPIDFSRLDGIPEEVKVRLFEIIFDVEKTIDVDKISSYTLDNIIKEIDEVLKNNIFIQKVTCKIEIENIEKDILEILKYTNTQSYVERMEELGLDIK